MGGMTISASAMRFDHLSLKAMSLAVPDTPGHPNKLPFSGVLTKVGEASDRAPHGSHGKRILLTRAAAEAALPTLLSMAVDFTPDLDGHDAKRKIGVITGATIHGNELRIEGFFYAADFPNEVARIRADKAAMGFSFEAQRILVEDPEADPLVITACVFTGAAVLQKDKGAYLTTRLAAQAAERNTTMSTTTRIELDHGTLRVLRLSNVTIPCLDVRAGCINAAADFNIDAFFEALEKQIENPRDRLHVKIAVTRACGNPRGVWGRPVGNMA
ncbi:MAG: hypothetical protein ACHQF3_00085 [Alphaproteobacteria bacterium]